MSAARLDNATREALAAFWATVARLYPDATSGDLDPATDAALAVAGRKAVGHWVECNIGLELDLDAPRAPVARGGAGRSFF